MGKPNTRRLDREIQQATRKLEAARKGEMWPLTGAEKRAVVRALAGGSYKVARGKSPGRAERKLETLWTSVQTRLSSDLTALQTERQRIVSEAATAKASKKSSGWW
ncbi:MULTISPECIES: hypothetical protein [unclassified Streptomyces]|uniref:hypothetical protein n=1 Tax=unclassified Streptomyces TaxID=2593676 RepID=UPI002365D35C|nr:MULTISPECIES: hypothetical protein [unclassified Streptomyces]MDF3140084.1 hypothetical protein [Streptomyces sp. T21Q-yed]WDF40153.1 hypothetical protein PBV52_26890 [Streptomyces sp. T12]